MGILNPGSSTSKEDLWVSTLYIDDHVFVRE